MEGIILWKGTTVDDYIKVWCKYGGKEVYLFDYLITNWNGSPDEDIFLQGGPKCLIKW